MGAIRIEGPKYFGKTWAGRYPSNSEVLLHKTTGRVSNNVELAKMSSNLILEGEKPKFEAGKYGKIYLRTKYKLG